MSTQKGKIIELAGPSGSGKTTLAKRLLEEFQQIQFSTSATTRPPRKNEVDGRDYYFLTDEEFNRNIKKGNFLEWETVYENIRYGTLKSEVDKHLKSGYFTMLDIDVVGALNVKNIYKDQCLAIFIKPPSLDVLQKRLISRKSESDNTLKVRLKRAEKELSYAHKFDHVVVNDNVKTAYQAIKKLVEPFIKSHT